jgi:hypothetical protein
VITTSMPRRAASATAAAEPVPQSTVTISRQPSASTRSTCTGWKP